MISPRRTGSHGSSAFNAPRGNSDRSNGGVIGINSCTSSLLVVVIQSVIFGLLLLTPVGGVFGDASADGMWLAALYNATNGAEWTSSCRAGWNIFNASSVCDSPSWYGVTCSSGVVTAVDLNNCNLKGGPLPDIPPVSLTAGRVGIALEHCRTLSLYSNSLSGALPPSFSSLSSLQVLDVHINSLNGSLPSSYGNMSRLQILNLHFNSLTGTLPTSLGNMTSLQELRLSSNSFTGSLPSCYSNLTSLYFLSLYSNSFSGTLPSSYGLMSSLQVLYVHANSLNGSLPSSYGNLSALLQLSLSSNSLTGSLPSSYANMSSIQRLILNSNSLTGSLPASYSAMSSLQTVYLYSNSLSGSLPPSYSSLMSLQCLALAYNSLSGSLPPVYSTLASLMYLDLSFNNLTGALPDSYGRLSSLQTMWLNSNNLNGSLPSSYGNLSSLQRLYLYSNSLTGSLPPEYGTMPRLQTLLLSENGLTGRLPSSFSRLASLMYLDLSFNSLTGTLPYSWYTMLSNWNDVSYNYLTGDIPLSWMWSNATIQGSFITGNCLTLSDMTAAIATGRFSAGGPRAPDMCKLAASFSVSAVPTVTRRALATMSEASFTRSLSLSSCQETVQCRMQQQQQIVGLCPGTGGCTLLDPGAETLPMSQLHAQVSRETLDKAAFGSLIAYVKCSSPRFMRLVNRSTAALDVRVTMALNGDWLVLLSVRGLQSGGWPPQQPHQQSPYKAFTMKFPLAAECGDVNVNITLEVLVTPLSLPQLAVGGAVQATDRAAMWLGAFGGGPSSGGGASRVAAVRSLLLCSKEGASTGGLLGLSLPRPADGDDDDAILLAYARGAVVGNTLVLVVWLVTLLVLAGVYYRRVAMLSETASPGLAACVRVALPSSLLPMCSTLLPSLSGGVLILGALEGVRLDVVDAVVVVTGCCVLAAVLAPMLWLCAPSFAARTLNATLLVVNSDSGEKGADAAGDWNGDCSRGVTAATVRLWRRAVKALWKWKRLPAGEGCAQKSVTSECGDTHLRTSFKRPCDASHAFRGCAVILSEHRCLWYAALDMWSLCATGLLGAASGVFGSGSYSGSSSVCSGAAIALTVMFLLQFVVLVAVRPLTSVFANVHAAFVLLVTGLGTALQAASIASSSGGAVEDWALLGAATCCFLVVGASIMRVVMVDAPHTLRAVRLFFQELLRWNVRSDQMTSAENPLLLTEDGSSASARTSTSLQHGHVELASPHHHHHQCEGDVDIIDEVSKEAVDSTTFWGEMSGGLLLLKRDADIEDVGDDGDDGLLYAEGGEALLRRFPIEGKTSGIDPIEYLQ